MFEPKSVQVDGFPFEVEMRLQLRHKCFQRLLSVRFWKWKIILWIQ